MSTRHSRRRLLFGTLASLAPAAALAQPGRPPMPPPRDERRPPPPRGRRDARWAPGRWAWRGNRWVWAPGGWR